MHAARGRAWLAILAGVAIVGLGVALGLLMERQNPRRDGEWLVDKWFADHRVPALNEGSRILELVFGPRVTPWVLVALLLVGFVARRPLRFGLLVLITGLGWLPGHFVKAIVQRPRPQGVNAIIVYHDTLSYPSGHVGFAVALSIAVCWFVRRTARVPWWLVVLAAVVVLTLATSRVYAGAHFPLDCLGGAMLDGGAALALWPPAAVLQRRWGAQRRHQRPAE